MKPPTQIRLKNRTGLQMSPVHSRQLLETVRGVDRLQPPPEGDGSGLARVRGEYAAEADPIGTLPPPGTLKGATQSSLKLLTGHRPQVFMDKLAERAAFERGGTRLYDAILAKFQALTDGAGSAAELPSGISIAELSRIRAQEADHFRLVSGSIEELGADPTAATPSADLVGMESTGLLQAVSDPRTGLADCLHAALAAELIDHAGWELLIEMADQMSSARLADRFRAARREEEDHLRLVRGWYAQLIHSQG